MSLIFPIGLLLILGFMSFATYRTGQLLQVWEPEQNLLLLPLENVARVILIIVCVGLGLVSGQTPEALGWIPQEPLVDIGLGIAFGLGYALLILAPTLWIAKNRPQWYSAVVLKSIRPRTTSEWPIVILALFPVALLEELLFRSLLLGGFAPYVNVVFFAVAASIYFGLLHLPQGQWGVVAVTLAGLLFSAVFLGRGSLLVVIIAHWVANVTQLGLAEWQARKEASPIKNTE